MRILVVDDDAAIRRDWPPALARESVRAVFVRGVPEARAELTRERDGVFDAIVLDVRRPPELGLGFLRDLRAGGRQTPVIVISSEESPDERVRAFELGGDDYLAKPLELQELVARLHAIVRRNFRTANGRVGEFEVDMARRRISYGGRNLSLSPREFDLLWILLQAEGRAVSRDELGLRLSTDGEVTGSNVVVVHLSRLRRKLARQGNATIETLRGRGYRLKA